LFFGACELFEVASKKLKESNEVTDRSAHAGALFDFRIN
jgi:hypothetical protein